MLCLPQPTSPIMVYMNLCLDLYSNHNDEIRMAKTQNYSSLKICQALSCFLKKVSK